MLRPFDRRALAVTAAGTISLTFTGYGTAVMTYDVEGVIATKEITRQPF